MPPPVINALGGAAVQSGDDRCRENVTTRPFRTDLPGAGLPAGPTQIGLEAFNKATRRRRLDKIESRSSQSDARTLQTQANRQNLLTPARRAALDALEREFHDLLNQPTRSAA